MTVRHGDDFGINAEFAASLAKACLRREFEQHTSTVWRIEDEFGEVA